MNSWPKTIEAALCRARVAFQGGRRVLALLALALWSSASLPAGPTPPPAVVYLPDAGTLFQFELASGRPVFITYSGNGERAAQPGKRCADDRWITSRIVSDGWLLLSISTQEAERPALDAWLDSRSAAVEALTQRELLERALRGVAAGLEVLMPTGRPDRVEFEVRVSELGCRHTLVREHSSDDARRHLSFPIVFLAPTFLISDRPFETELLWLMELIAHETAHVLQLFPFDRERLTWLERARPMRTSAATAPISLSAEISAMFIDRCIRLAVMPPTLDDERPAQAWLADKAHFLSLIDDRAYAQLYDEFFGLQLRVLGKSFVDPMQDDRSLGRLLGLCARAGRRPHHLFEYAMPTAEELQVGRRALARMRSNGEPIVFRRLAYPPSVIR